MTKELDQVNIYRRLNGNRLVIFERQGTLLRQKHGSRTLSLDDIDETLLHVLHRLRCSHFNFGFISDHGGVEDGQAGQQSASTLIHVLDGILGAYGASPHFWLAWPPTAAPESSTHFANQKFLDTAGMIARILEHYDLEISKCVFVGTTLAGLAAAAGLGVDALQYSAFAESNVPKSETAELITLQIMGLAARSRSARQLGRRRSW